MCTLLMDIHWCVVRLVFDCCVLALRIGMGGTVCAYERGRKSEHLISEWNRHSVTSDCMHERKWEGEIIVL